MKVLLYENDQDQLRVLRNNLENQDYELLVEKEAGKVLSHLEGNAPELVISNFNLPNGGIELVNQMLATLEQPFPYVLFITETNSEKYAIDCLGPIPGDFVSKPLREEEFRARILVAERAIALQNHLRTQQETSPDVALYDDLTNLLNRQAVYERALGELNRAQREKMQTCLVLMEIINIDAILEKYGEKVSRQAIRFVARAIRANLRMYDLVGRWMGARFLILLPGVSNKYSKNVIGRIYDAVRSVRIRLEDDTHLPLELAVGFTISDPDKPAPLYMLIDQANMALTEGSKQKPEKRMLAFGDLEEFSQE